MSTAPSKFPRAPSNVRPFSFAGLLDLMLDGLPEFAAEDVVLRRSLAAQAAYLRGSVACLQRLHGEIVICGSPSIGTMQTAASLIELADLPFPQGVATVEEAY